MAAVTGNHWLLRPTVGLQHADGPPSYDAGNRPRALDVLGSEPVDDPQSDALSGRNVSVSPAGYAAGTVPNRIVNARTPHLPADVWAEEPGTRVKAAAWGDGVILSIYDIDGSFCSIASIAGYRWKRLLATLQAGKGHE